MIRKPFEFTFTEKGKGMWKKQLTEGVGEWLILPAQSILRGPTCLVLDKLDLHKFQQEKQRPLARVTFCYQHPDTPIDELNEWDRITLQRDTSEEYRGWECKPEFLLLSELNAYKERCITESTKEMCILDWNVKKLPKQEIIPLHPMECLILFEDKRGEIYTLPDLVDDINWCRATGQGDELDAINHAIIPIGESGYHYAIHRTQLSALSRISSLTVTAIVTGREGFEHTFETISIVDSIDEQLSTTQRLQRILELCLYFPQLVYLERCAEKTQDNQNQLEIRIHLEADYPVDLSISDLEMDAGFQLFDCLCKLSQLAHEKLDRLFD